MHSSITHVTTRVVGTVEPGVSHHRVALDVLRDAQTPASRPHTSVQTLRSFRTRSRQSFQLALVCGQVPKQATHTPTPYRNLDTPDPTKVKICQTQIRSRLLIIWIENWTTPWDSVGQVGCVDLAVCGLGYMVDADPPPSRVCVL